MDTTEVGTDLLYAAYCHTQSLYYPDLRPVSYSDFVTMWGKSGGTSFRSSVLDSLSLITSRHAH